jgi:hypothetical protein
VFKRLIAVAGVLSGAKIARLLPVAKPNNPDLATVGNAGYNDDCSGLVTASNLNLPDLTYGKAAAQLPIIICTPPPAKSLYA